MFFLDWHLVLRTLWFCQSACLYLVILVPLVLSVINNIYNFADQKKKVVNCVDPNCYAFIIAGLCGLVIFVMWRRNDDGSYGRDFLFLFKDFGIFS